MEEYELSVPHYAQVMVELRGLYQDQAFSDLTIQLKDGTMYISRLHFAALSPLFKCMLTTDMTERRNNRVVFENITVETWTFIMEFYFGRRKFLTMEIVDDVLQASHMYLLDGLTRHCCVFLTCMCSPKTCRAIIRIATKLSLESLAKMATKVLTKNFSTVCKTDEIPDFSIEALEAAGPYCSEVMAELRDMYQDQAFTDLTIQLKDGTMYTSRLHFAALSPDFRRMLTDDMIKRGKNRVVFEDVTVETWTHVMEFYFGIPKLLLTMENAEDVLQVSVRYQLVRLTGYSCFYVYLMCSTDTWLAIKRMATRLSLESTAKWATKVFTRNFSTLCKTDDFLRLEKSELLELLEKEELVTTEDDLCEALLLWMKARDADADTCIELFQHVCLQRLSCACLGASVLYNSIMPPTLLSKFQDEDAKRAKDSQYRRAAAVTRRCGLRTDRVLVVVGESKGWTHLPFRSHTEWKFDLGAQIGGVVLKSSTLLGQTIVTTGNHPNKSCYLHDLASMNWSAGPDLVQPRCSHGMTTASGKVYVVGGCSAFSQSLSSIEELDMDGFRWSAIGDLKFGTHECGVTSLGDTILVAGGDTAESQSLIQTFNVETRRAAVLDARLPRPMRHVQAASFGNTAFFVGEEGDLVQVTEVGGGFQMTSHVRLQGFGRRKFFGVHVTETCVLVFTGEEEGTVLCWDHTGKELANEEVALLEDEMNIVGVFEVEPSPCLDRFLSCD